MQLKAIIKNIAKEKHISAQLVMQNFMLERLLERISVSEYQRNFILKGGFLIAAMVGLDTRATMDMDATIKGLPINEQTVREMFEEICKIELADDVTFSLRSIGEICEEDEYAGYRVSLSANYPPMAVPLKLDITTGDKITPKEIEYRFKLLLEFHSLKAALNETVEKRGSTAVVKNYSKIMATVRNSEIMKKQWDNYKKDFEYAMGIAFEDTCDTVVKLMDAMAGL